MSIKTGLATLLILLLILAGVFAPDEFETPARTQAEPARERSFDGSKRQLARIYAPNRKTFYCGCTYSEHGEVNLASCGYKVRRSESRARRLEWEHVVPASYFGSNLPCWKEGGREACRRSNAFANFEGDMHNLVPEIGELNGDRSNKVHMEVDGTSPYGRCDFKWNSIGAEPRDEVKGDVARIWLYMAHKYNMFISSEMRRTFEDWSKLDPVDDYERWRNAEIQRVQGDSNIFIK